VPTLKLFAVGAKAADRG